MVPCNPDNSTDTEASVPQILDDEDEMTEEEDEIYYRAVTASQGFDVPSFPHRVAMGIIQPVHPNLMKQYAKTILKAATLSIKDYNKRNGSNYEVVEIIKANSQVVQGRIYFVTFSVKPAGTPKDFAITIFQAKVYFAICPKKTKIYICRPKPNEGEKMAGDQCGLQCCC